MKSNRPKSSASTAKVAPTPTTPAAKLKALESALGDIERAYGKGSIMRLGSQVTEAIPCSS